MHKQHILTTQPPHRAPCRRARCYNTGDTATAGSDSSRVASSKPGSPGTRTPGTLIGGGAWGSHIWGECGSFIRCSPSEGTPAGGADTGGGRAPPENEAPISWARRGASADAQVRLQKQTRLSKASSTFTFTPLHSHLSIHT